MVAKSENAKKRLFKMIESQTKEKNKVKKQKCVPKNKMKVESESEEENDALCLICLEPFSESKPAALMIVAKISAFSDAPPTNAPSTSGWLNSSAALLAFTDPPY
ncbi:hypothetical protein J6590_106921 [Homalodisca vitripennis]|nr:hypothetical protein J6590_106921 [Homalodisca vitripennis]